MNGVPAPLAEDEDSDFGHESWYDRKDDKKVKTKGRRRSRNRGGLRTVNAKHQADNDSDRIANFNLLDHGFPSEESDEEPLFGDDHGKPRSRNTYLRRLISPPPACEQKYPRLFWKGVVGISRSVLILGTTHRTMKMARVTKQSCSPTKQSKPREEQNEARKLLLRLATAASKLSPTSRPIQPHLTARIRSQASPLPGITRA